MACRRLLRTRAALDSLKLLSGSSRCSPSSTALLGCRIPEAGGVFGFDLFGLSARSVATAGFTPSSGGGVGSWDLFVSFRMDAGRANVCTGDKDLASRGVRHVSGIGRMSAEQGETGSTAATASGDAETAVKPRRFAILTTGYGAPFCIDKYGGYAPMFIAMLGEPGEVWDEYLVVEGQFPSPEELPMYDGFVVTGSRHDAHGDEEWIEKLCGILRRLHEMRKKSLCVCFGHQVLSRALGGTTGRAPIGWEVGLREISLTDAFFSKSYAAGIPPKLKVLQVHRDQVMEIPPGAELLASSQRTRVEMFAVGEHALAIQGHPEFFEDVVVDLLEGRLAPMMTEEEKKIAEESLSKEKPDQKTLYQLCKDFLKGRNE